MPETEPFIVVMQILEQLALCCWSHGAQVYHWWVSLPWWVQGLICKVLDKATDAAGKAIADAWKAKRKPKEE